MTSPDVLAQPLSLPCGAVLPNRIAKAAMSEGLASQTSGAPTEAMIRVYERWSRSGAGLMLTGNVMVNWEGRAEPGQVVVEDERDLPMLRRWADVAQAGGGRLWMQINHAGRQAPKRIAPVPLAPSAIPMKGFGGMFAPPRALEAREIEALVRRFAVVAAIARDAGFAGVQIHGAHGYLVSQFLSPLTNVRDDAWGGDPERRRRFLLELVRAMRAVVGPRFPISVKLNSADFQRGGFTTGEAMEVASALETAGVDLIEISGGTYERPAMTGTRPLQGGERASTRAREAYFLEYAREIRTATRVPLLLTGGLRTAATMREVVSSGAVDMVGLARPMTTEPELPARLLDGRATAAVSVSPKVPVRLLNDLLAVVWFQEQIERMGRGQDPDLQLGSWGVVWRALRLRRFGPHGPREQAPTSQELVPGVV